MDPLVDDRPLRAVVRGWRWAPWVLGALAVLRLVAVAGLRLFIYFDSGEYERIDFTGDWRRPWATPYLYWLIPGGDHWIPVGQALVGALCWGVLAVSAAAWFRRSSMQVAVAVLLAGLACTTIVTNWDAAKLSESLGLSLTVLVLGAWLNFLRRPDRLTALWVVVATFPWLFVRQSLMSAAWLVVLAAALGALLAWRRHRPAKVLAILAIVLGAQALLASVSYTHNQEIVQENLTVIVANRIAPDPGRLAWFEDQGMPVPLGGGLDVGSLEQDPAFSHWAAGEGRGTYLRYLLSHPWYTATEPLEDFVGSRHPSADVQPPPADMLAPDDVYAASRPVLPDLAEEVLFGPGDTGAVILGLLAVVGWTAARRRDRDRRWVAPLVLIAISFASLYTGWHGATPELGRLALVGALGVRIGLVLQLAFLVEGELDRRSAAQPPVDRVEPATS